VRELADLIAERGAPEMIVGDNGAALTFNAVLAWSRDVGAEWHYIAPDKPTQNGFVGSFNGRMRDELLNETLFSESAGRGDPRALGRRLQHRAAALLARLCHTGSLRRRTRKARAPERHKGRSLVAAA
jgi:transposase InsO family protein